MITAFVVRCLDSTISLLAIDEISRPKLASVAEQAGLSLNWSQTPKAGFVVTWLIYEPSHDKTNKMTCVPSEDQISLGIRLVWSESSLELGRYGCQPIRYVSRYGKCDTILITIYRCNDTAAPRSEITVFISYKFKVHLFFSVLQVICIPSANYFERQRFMITFRKMLQYHFNYCVKAE